MISAEVFRQRRALCLACEHWAGACLKRHTLQAPVGCPARKFPPVDGADYLPDLAPIARPAPPTGTACCGQSAELKPLTYTQAVAHLTQSMSVWADAGFPFAPANVYEKRVALCKACEHYRFFQCKLCHCIVLSKAKLATEACPTGKW